MKIDFTAHWDREAKSFTIINEPLFLERMSEKPSGYMDCTCEEEWQWKSDEARGYFFAEVCVKAMMGYNSRGIKVKDKEMAYMLLCLEETIDCTNKVIDEFTGNMIARVPKSFSSLGKRQLSELTSDSIMFIELELGVQVEPPEVYKEKRKLKK